MASVTAEFPVTSIGKPRAIALVTNIRIATGEFSKNRGGLEGRAEKNIKLNYHNKMQSKIHSKKIFDLLYGFSRLSSILRYKLRK